jgi:hypothetical protein
VLPTGAGTEVGGEPTAATDIDAGAGAADEVDRWSRGGTPSGTSGEHYRMEQPQPSSSWFPCEHILHHPRSRGLSTTPPSTVAYIYA